MPISPYVRRLREHVGTDTLLIPSAAVVLRDQEGRVLLARDADSELWILIGGAIEIDETPEEAAVREAAEEVNVTIRIRRLLGVASGPECRVRYPNGDKTAYVVIIYEGEIIDGTPRPDDEEIIATRWVDPSEIETVDLSRITRALLTTVGLLTA
jgi:8-oxo-dGTP pyrophosphatase MutT (NUDIX family)